MSDLFDDLQNWGCNVPEALNRFLQDKDLYTKCQVSFSTDESFEKIKEHLNNKEFKLAFDDAHTLKGVSANLSLTPLYEAVCKVVEDLRHGPSDSLEDDYRKYEAVYQQYLEIMNAYGQSRAAGAKSTGLE